MVWLKEKPFTQAPNVDSDTVEFTGGTKGSSATNNGNTFSYNPDNEDFKICNLEYKYVAKEGYLFLNFSSYTTAEGASGGGIIKLPRTAQVTSE